MQFKPESFPRSMRIRKTREYNALYTGKRVSGPLFVIHYKYMGTHSKAGITVSKKVSKSAVVRNTLKRRLREIYRLNKTIIPEGISLVIRVLPKAAGADFYEIKREILLLFTLIASKKHSNNVD